MKSCISGQDNSVHIKSQILIHSFVRENSCNWQFGYFSSLMKLPDTCIVVHIFKSHYILSVNVLNFHFIQPEASN